MNTATLSEQQLMDRLRLVQDPEINCNIVDLGLVYGLQMDAGKVTVQMTLTTQGCPMHQSIIWGVQSALLALETVEEVDVELVWDPPWNPAMMSDEGRRSVGLGPR